MPVFQRASLQRKQTLIIMVTSSVALLMACTAFVTCEVITFRREMLRNLSTLAEMIGDTTTAALEFDDPKAADETLAALRAEPNILHACIYTRTGRPFAQYSRGNASRAWVPPTAQTNGHQFKHHDLVLFHGVIHHGEGIGTVYLNSDLRALSWRLREYGWIVALVLLASSLVAFLLSSRLQRLISGPILQLVQTARTVAANKNYSLRAVKQSEDELGLLIDGFNEMLMQIQAQDTVLQRAQADLETKVAERTRELQLQIAERERADAAIRASEALNRSIMASALDCVISIDSQGRILEFNPAAERTFDYTREEAIGQDMAALIVAPALRERYRLGLANYLATGQSAILGKRIEISALRKTGAEFPVELAVTCIQHRGTTAFTAFLRDITERKRAEEELNKAKEAAEAANLAKSHFLANMSHEIRTPINGIMGMTELALDTALTDEQRGLLNTVKESSDTLLALINDILDFSKIEAGKLDLDPVNFDLREGLEDTMLSLAVRAHQKGLELACHVPPEVPDALMGDPGRLRQVVMNLVGNAIKFTESGEVALHAAVKSRTETEVCLHFTVADTGIGIPPGKQELIFEAFIQGDSSTTRHYGGTGLGLAICSELIELMGGIIWVESELGQGSRFHFTVRFGLQKNPVPKISLEQLHLQDLPVLVVDDNATNRRVLEELLNTWEMKPVAVESGEAALAAIQRGLAANAPFAVALLDAAMPGMDGFTLAEEIKKYAQFSGGVVMMLSSAAQLEDAGRCRSLGIPAYLTKPVKQSDLLDAILTALGKAPACSRRISPGLSAFAKKHRKALRVLLAEDNPVNQRLARRILEKWGHTVVVAANGKKALAAWEREVFDLILMDVQMPEMSGLETTAAIRERERTTGKHLPIIAMTAHALKGDRERCLAAGMDAYVPKPIDPKKLATAIETQIGSAAAASSTPTKEGSREPGFDSNSVLERVGGDRELLKEVASLFFEDTPRLLAEIRAAIDHNDPPALERSAHRLKGSVSNFGAKAAQEAALRLELMGRAGDVSTASGRYQELERELAAVTSAIESLLKKEAA